MNTTDSAFLSTAIPQPDAEVEKIRHIANQSTEVGSPPFSITTLFQTNQPKRDKFASRLFGIFSEEIVRIWTQDQRSPYINLGRPTLYHQPDQERYTLDFTLQDQNTGKVYVSEMKCELEYENYRYMILTTPKHLEHHKGQAFKFLLDIIPHSKEYTVKISGREHLIDGAILVWGHCSEEGRELTKQKYGFHTILSLQDMIRDLHTWNNAEYSQLISNYHQWSNGLFEGLQNHSY